MKFVFGILVIVIAFLITLAGIRIASPGGLWGYKYESTAVIEIHVRPMSHAPWPSERKRTMEIYIEDLLSNHTLKSTSNDLRLSQRWDLSSEIAFKQLKTIVSAKHQRDTDFIEIKVGSDVQEDAQNLANAVADHYVHRINFNNKERAKKAIKALDTELASQEKEVLLKKKYLVSWIGSYGIPFFEGRDATEQKERPPVTHRSGKKGIPKIEEAIRLGTYQETLKTATQEYEQARDLLREMKLRQVEQRMILKNPPPLVTRHE